MNTFESVLNRGNNDIEITVGYSYEPAQRGGWYTPPIPAYIMIHSVTTGGVEIETTEAEDRELEEEAWANLALVNER